MFLHTPRSSLHPLVHVLILIRFKLLSKFGLILNVLLSVGVYVQSNVNMHLITLWFYKLNVSISVYCVAKKLLLYQRLNNIVTLNLGLSFNFWKLLPHLFQFLMISYDPITVNSCAIKDPYWNRKWLHQTWQLNLCLTKMLYS
jgi:hypothetical protein